MRRLPHNILALCAEIFSRHPLARRIAAEKHLHCELECRTSAARFWRTTCRVAISDLVPNLEVDRFECVRAENPQTIRELDFQIEAHRAIFRGLSTIHRAD